MVSTTAYALMILLGILAIVFSFYCKKNSLEPTKRFLSYRFYAVLLIVFGYILHTFGDYTSNIYGHFGELAFESMAHVIIFISLLIFVKGFKSLFEDTRGYGFA